jgi:uncharacterized membrane protein
VKNNDLARLKALVAFYSESALSYGAYDHLTRTFTVVGESGDITTVSREEALALVSQPHGDPTPVPESAPETPQDPAEEPVQSELVPEVPQAPQEPSQEAAEDPTPASPAPVEESAPAPTDTGPVDTSGSEGEA